MEHFTPLPSLLGGALIGLAASLLLVANGRVAGISGILGGALLPARGDVRWRLLFLAGLVGTAAGLVLGGMTRPEKIVGFLDFTGRWDPSLAFVMAGALLVHGLLYRLITRRPAPLFGGRFHLPTRRDIDRRLVLGAALFGVGWG